jgi:hypothetical protein
LSLANRYRAELSSQRSGWALTSGVVVVVLRGGERGPVRLAFEPPGMGYRFTWFQPTMTHPRVRGWVGERSNRINGIFPPSLFGMWLMGASSPRRLCFRIHFHRWDCALPSLLAALQLRAISASFSISAIMYAASFGAGHPVRCTCTVAGIQRPQAASPPPPMRVFKHAPPPSTPIMPHLPLPNWLLSLPSFHSSRT